MLTKDEFDSLEVGHQLEMHPLLPGVSDENVLLIVSEALPEKKTFAATLFGVTLGTWTCTMKGGALEWTV